jgi:hypothetical protein
MLELSDRDFKAVILKKCLDKKSKTHLKQILYVKKSFSKIEDMKIFVRPSVQSPVPNIHIDELYKI